MYTNRVVLANGSIVPSFLRILKWWPVLAIKAKRTEAKLWAFSCLTFSLCGSVCVAFILKKTFKCKLSLLRDFFEKAVDEGSATHQKGEKKNPLNTERLKGEQSLILIIDAFHAISVFLRDGCLIHPRPCIFSLGRCENTVLHSEPCQYPRSQGETPA